MEPSRRKAELPPIPAKRYFTIGEVSELCGVKPHVLRYWEQEFTQLKPVKRRGNRRYYQHHEVLLIRSIRELLYDQGYTISGARNKLDSRIASQNDESVDLAAGLHALDSLYSRIAFLSGFYHQWRTQQTRKTQSQTTQKKWRFGRGFACARSGYY